MTGVKTLNVKRGSTQLYLVLWPKLESAGDTTRSVQTNPGGDIQPNQIKTNIVSIIEYIHRQGSVWFIARTYLHARINLVLIFRIWTVLVFALDFCIYLEKLHLFVVYIKRDGPQCFLSVPWVIVKSEQNFSPSTGEKKSLFQIQISPNKIHQNIMFFSKMF